jgi:ABC-type Fe3+ transport system permease subunit
MLTKIGFGLALIVMLVILMPVIGGTMENAQPDMGVSSSWNQTYNDDLPDGATLWSNWLTYLGIAVLALLFGIAFMYLRNSMRGS